MTAETFFKEFQRIIAGQPMSPLRIQNSENCDFGNYIFYSKNLYRSFDCANCTDSQYLFDSYMTTSSLDCDYAVESILCYDSVDPFKCFNCAFIEYCSNMRDSMYCYDCIDCHDVFGCVLLRNKSFCIFNRQFSEQEYREKLKQYMTLPPEKVLAMVEDLKNRFPSTQTHDAHNENTTYGDYIHYNKNCYLCFDAAHNENCAYLYDSFYNSSSNDLTYVGQSNELCYECIDTSHCFNCNFVIDSSNCQDASYLYNCAGMTNSLGCAGLTHRRYCILNRQFSQTDYEKISSQIMQELRTKNLGWDGIAI